MTATDRRGRWESGAQAARSRRDSRDETQDEGGLSGHVGILASRILASQGSFSSFFSSVQVASCERR
jgi:hypothetical protein